MLPVHHSGILNSQEVLLYGVVMWYSPASPEFGCLLPRERVMTLIAYWSRSSSLDDTAMLRELLQTVPEIVTLAITALYLM